MLLTCYIGSPAIIYDLDSGQQVKVITLQEITGLHKHQFCGDEFSVMCGGKYLLINSFLLENKSPEKTKSCHKIDLASGNMCSNFYASEYVFTTLKFNLNRMGNSKSPIPLFPMFIYTWQRPFNLPECVSNLIFGWSKKPLTSVQTHGKQKYRT